MDERRNVPFARLAYSAHAGRQIERDLPAASSREGHETRGK